jgi:hypothetical protein
MSDLIIKSVNTAGTDLADFSQNNTCGTIPTGGSCLVNVTFTPILPYANKTATLAIASNDPKNPIFNVNLSGLVPPPVISATPASVNLGSVKLGASSAQKVITVKNTGMSDLIIKSIYGAGTDVDDFSQNNTCGTIPTGGSCLVNVTFNPILPYGNKTAALAIDSNDPKKPTATVTLSGQAPPPVISASPTTVILTAAGLNMPSAAATVTIKNTGFSDLNISKATITGTNASPFAMTNTLVSPLPSGESCTVDVTFTPDSPGAKNASLVIDSDDPKNPQVTVDLTGKIRNYTTADLAGTWIGSMLATSGKQTVWFRSTYIVKSDGSFTATATNATKTTIPPFSGKLSITPNGQISEPKFDLLCDMNAGKTVLTCTSNTEYNDAVYTVLNVFIKQGDSYIVKDLEGNWSGNVISADVISATDPTTNTWTRITYNINEDGSFTGTAVDSNNNNSGQISGIFGITTEGVLTDNGALQCNMDEGKTVIACTATSGSMVNIQVYTKGSASYTAADLAGTWAVNSMAVGLSAPCWDRETVTINPDETFTSQETYYDGKTNKQSTKSGSGTLQILANVGGLTFYPGSSQLCQVDASETVVSCTETWNDGSKALTVFTRNLQ